LKTALLVGCGRNFGYDLTKCYLDAGYSVWNMGSHSIEGCNFLEISWKTLDIVKLKEIAEHLPSLDSVFFNHYAGTRIKFDDFRFVNQKQELKDWTYTNWINCQMPVYLIKILSSKINKNTRIGWQLGWGNSLNLDMNDPQWQHVPYASQKLTNFMAMRAFAQLANGIYYATFPGHLTEDNRRERAERIFKIQESISEQDNGRAIHFDGTDYIGETDVSRADTGSRNEP